MDTKKNVMLSDPALLYVPCCSALPAPTVIGSIVSHLSLAVSLQIHVIMRPGVLRQLYRCQPTIICLLACLGELVAGVQIISGERNSRSDLSWYDT